MDRDPPAPSRSFEPLSRRERDILVLLSQDLSDQQIAQRLFIARTTVKWYNRQIFNKLGAENRQEAVKYGRSMGLLNADGAPASSRHPLPAPLTPFVGRIHELSEASRWLSQPTLRLMTILAPGGMGKTRFALQVAEAVLDRYADGVYFVPLAGLTSPDPLISTLAEALGIQFAPGGRPPKQQLFDALRRKHLLLVLDNFEHLLDSGPLVAELLLAASQITALATSREKLNVTGELIYPLAGLEAPDDTVGDAPGHSDAIQLFIACAQRANPHFVPEDTASMRRICRLVQGMPLAIELAAAWSGTLAPAEIADEVSWNADFLQTTRSDVPERLRSVRMVFETTWGRLREEARQVYRRMAVFRGGFTREAAQVVTGADIHSLALLLDKALLWRNPTSERYEVHELLRQYAEQELVAAGEADLIEHAHQHYYAQLAMMWSEAMLSNRQLEGLTALDADDDNVRQAQAHATAEATPEALEPFTDLWIYFFMRSRWEEADKGMRAASDALEPHDSLALAKLLTARSILYDAGGMLEPAMKTGKRGYEMTVRLGVRRPLPLAMFAYADAFRDAGNHAEALGFYQAALPVTEEIDDPLVKVMLMFHLAYDAELNGRMDEAQAKMQEAYAGASALNNLWAKCFCANRLAYVAAITARLDEAERLYNEYLKDARTIGLHYMEVLAQMGLSLVARQRKDWVSVDRFSRDALRMQYEVGDFSEDAPHILTTLAESAMMLNDLDEALRRLREAFTLRDQILSAGMFVQFETITAGYLVHTGDFRLAVALLSHGEHTLTVHPDTMVPIDLQHFGAMVVELLDECRASLMSDAYAAAVEQGKSLTNAQVIAVLSRIL